MPARLQSCGMQRDRCYKVGIDDIVILHRESTLCNRPHTINNSRKPEESNEMLQAFCMQCNYELSIKELPQILHIKGSFDIIFRIEL